MQIFINCKAINYTHVWLIHAHRVRTVYRPKEHNGSPSNRVIFSTKIEGDCKPALPFPLLHGYFYTYFNKPKRNHSQTGREKKKGKERKDGALRKLAKSYFVRREPTKTLA